MSIWDSVWTASFTPHGSRISIGRAVAELGEMLSNSAGTSERRAGWSESACRCFLSQETKLY
jgi:hypothetical protein